MEIAATICHRASYKHTIIDNGKINSLYIQETEILYGKISYQFSDSRQEKQKMKITDSGRTCRVAIYSFIIELCAHCTSKANKPIRWKKY